MVTIIKGIGRTRLLISGRGNVIIARIKERERNYRDQVDYPRQPQMQAIA